MSMFRNALPLFVAVATAAAASPSFADTDYTLTNPGEWCRRKSAQR